MRPAKKHLAVIAWINTHDSFFPFSVAEIAQATNASTATVRVVLARLLRMGLVSHSPFALKHRYWSKTKSWLQQASQVEDFYELLNKVDVGTAAIRRLRKAERRKEREAATARSKAKAKRKIPWHKVLAAPVTDESTPWLSDESKRRLR